MLDLLLNLDDYLRQFALAYPVLIYGLLWLVLFLETAFFPVSPFLPGDGLLFAVGVLAAGGLVGLWTVMLVLILGAAMGAYVGYWLGRRAGPLLFTRLRWLDRRDYDRAHTFYVKYGATALILSRFLPIVKALVPFVAGVAGMRHERFVRYNILSAVIWVVTLVPLGYFLGSIPFVEEHATLLIVGLAAGGVTLTLGLAAYRAIFGRKRTDESAP